MSDVCIYSGLPYNCSFCTEDSAPCFYKECIRKQNRILFLNLFRVWVCNDNELLTLPRVYDYGYKVI